ncbi:MAG: DUF177 domain-containing protein [Alphaproteobacteria bacterium]|nr:DUF177 domain-containing protein [Alphaproteobacteria bacterium]
MAVSSLAHQAMDMDIVASDRERAALAERLKIDRLDALNAHALLTLLPSGDVRLDVRFQARVTQTCSITLDPVHGEVSRAFTTTYSAHADEDWGHGEEEFTDLDDDIEPPEPIIGGTIDVGEAVVEQLALEIDPFPRVKGAHFDGFSTDPKGPEPEPEEKRNPFAVLSKLKLPPESAE